MRLSPLRNHILFQFEDGTTNHMGARQFENSTEWGFQIVRTDDSTQSARWVIITHTGPECEEYLKPGMRVLIDPLMWSEGFKVDGQEYWRTDDRRIALVDESAG